MKAVQGRALEKREPPTPSLAKEGVRCSRRAGAARSAPAHLRLPDAGAGRPAHRRQPTSWPGNPQTTARIYAHLIDDEQLAVAPGLRGDLRGERLAKLRDKSRGEAPLPRSRCPSSS